MTPRRRRMLLVGLIVAAVAGSVALALSAFRENMLYYVTPSEITADTHADGRAFRLGGMVKQGSVERASGSLTVRFVVTDFQHDLPVTYTGVLPDLFREGQGVIARGKLNSGVLHAEEVLAKHDEKYMPPEIAEKIKKEHGGTLPVAKP